jgi:hypothetical protein
VLLGSAVAHAQCTKDTDCKGDRVCDAGKCTAPEAVAPPATPAPATGEPVPADPATPGETPPAEGQPTTEPPPAPEAAPVTPQPPLDAGPDPGAPVAPPAAVKPLGADEPAVRRRNRNMMVGGIVMVSVGPVALLGALSARNSQENCDEQLESQYPSHMVPSYDAGALERCDNYTVPIYLFGIGGAVLIAAGIPMIIYGGKNVAAAPAKRAQVLPWATPTSGGLRLRLDL